MKREKSTHSQMNMPPQGENGGRTFHGRGAFHERRAVHGSKSEKIFQALAAADEELLARSEQKAGKRWITWRTLTPMAACLCMAVAGILLWQTGLLKDQGATGGAPEMANQDTGQIVDMQMEEGNSMEEKHSVEKGDGGTREAADEAVPAAPEEDRAGASALEEAAVLDDRLDDTIAEQQTQSVNVQDNAKSMAGSMVPLAELPALVFVEKQEKEDVKTADVETAVSGSSSSYALSEDEIAGIWGADSISEVSWEGMNPFEQYDITATVIYDKEGKVRDVEIQGSGKETGEVTFRIHMTPGQVSISGETTLSRSTCQIHGTDVAAVKQEYTLRKETIYVYEAEFVKAGRESIGVGIRVEGTAAKGRERAYDLITRFVSGFLREEMEAGGILSPG